MSEVQTQYEISSEDYHSLTGVSNSRLNDFIDDPRVYWYKHLSGRYKRESKAHFDFGSAVHEIVLLGDNSNIVVIPESVLSKSGSRAGGAWKDFEAQNAGKILLKQHDYDAVMRCVDSVFEHPVASKLLQAEGVAERMFRATDDLLQLDLRCKPDYLATINGASVVVDLKTTQVSTSQAFAKSVANFRYANQEYFYRRVLQANNIDVRQFIFVAVSVEQPHTVDCYTLSPEFLRYGETSVENALADLAERTRSNDWQSRTVNKVVELSPPNYLKYASEYQL